MTVPELRQHFMELAENNTRTAARVIFIEDLLKQGMSKREAAHLLSDVDPLLGKGSAETIAYTNFSGRYRTVKRPETAKHEAPTIESPTDIEDDEGLL